MRVVVAGASGVIGRPLVSAVREAGHEVIGLVHSRRGGEAARSAGATQVVVVDVLDREALLGAVGGMRAEVVVHELTGYRNAPPTRYRGAGVRRTNLLRTTGTTHLLDLAARVGAKRFVTQSLILGYGLINHGTAPITEDRPFGVLRGHPSDPSISAIKQAEELAFAAPDLDAIALRYGIFYGAEASAVFIAMLRRMMLPLPREGTGQVGWVHLDDAVRATVAAIEHGRPGRAYNIVDDEPVAWDVMLAAMAAAAGARRPVRLPSWLIRSGAPFAATQMLDMSMRVANSSAREDLGWRPAIPSYREGLGRPDAVAE
ncbi:NAD-dependent epimerase/dehydratase family protein [Nocardia sp. NPDC052566]|uniref:NAD-dependent epimerase/dehydratase family protein n=1 Tax=Nocardia sp. NPDC052566 TaxID=3364330 RepID=UPI0037C728F0